MYRIARINSMDEFEKAELFRLEHYLWESTYQPEVFGRLAYLPGREFVLKMVCREANPVRVYKNNDDPVCRDSCMEAFLNFKPSDTGPGYVSFEMNANGALLSSLGTGRHNRVFLKDMGLAALRPEVVINPDFWQVQLTIPVTLLGRLYGEIDFETGRSIRGNFYKCGDETPSPHYGAWSRVCSEQPDFHLPQYFGSMVTG